MRKFDVTALGEILIDYTPLPKSESGMMVFEQNPGGAPANVLACLAKLGRKTAFIGKVGTDMQGNFLKSVLDKAEIETRALIFDESVFTTLAFVSLDDNGDRSFAFARKPGADTMLRFEEVDLELIEDSKIFHFGSLSLTDNPAREATLFAIENAKRSGAIISYDPNYRTLLWPSVENAIANMRSVLDSVDIIKLSDEEIFLLTNENDIEKASKVLLSKGISIVAITLGENGVFIANQNEAIHVPSKKVSAVDTTGAGDAFWGGFLYKLTESEKKPKDLDINEIKNFAIFANSVAGICVQRRGAIPAMPTLDEII